MDFSTITSFINEAGFPIAAFFSMFWLVTTTLKQNTDALNNNTNVMTKLMERMEHKDGE